MKESEKPIRSLPRRNWWSVAATFLILVLMGYFLRNHFRGANEWEEISVVDKMTEALVLSDGTKVWLDKNSSFSRPDHFSVKERRIRLKGAAYLEVVANTNRPFVVQTESGEVKVLGTSFHIRDYSTEEKMKVEVTAGRVEVKTRDESQRIYLDGGESGILNKKDKTLIKEKN